MNARRPSHWEDEVLYNTGDEYFAGLLNAIRLAKTSIELETYIFEKGILADRMVTQLMQASRRGVKVRILVDGWGSPGFAAAYWPQLKHAGVKVRFFRVSPWILWRLPGDPRNPLYRLFLRLRKVNQ